MEWIDWGVIAAYAAVVLWIGVRAGRGRQTSEDLFLGGRRIPAWAALCSMVATELSAATFIGVPEFSYDGNWWYLQYAFGTFAARVVLATWFLSLYYRLRLVTVYGFLDQRFGRRAQLCSSWFFVAGRIFASGARLYIAALAFATVTGFSMQWAIVFAGVLASAYTLAGGIRAVIWTDTLQGAVFLVSAGVCLAVAVTKSGLGLEQIWSAASEAGRTRVWHLPAIFTEGTSAEETWAWLGACWDGFRANYLESDRSLVVAILGGFFLTMATHGTDQDMVQRLLTTRDSRQGGRALIGSGVLIFPIVSLFLLLGVALAAFYAAKGSTVGYEISSAAKILPQFVYHEVPAGLRGLVFAGLFAAAMSSMDSALNSLATTWIVDIRRSTRDGAGAARTIRWATLVFAAFLILAALFCSYLKDWYDARPDAPPLNLITLALSTMTMVYGSLLGAFLCGLVTRTRGNDTSVFWGMIVSGAIGVFLFAQQPLFGHTYVVWPWWIIIGTLVSFTIGALGRSPTDRSDLI